MQILFPVVLFKFFINVVPSVSREISSFYCLDYNMSEYFFFLLFYQYHIKNWPIIMNVLNFPNTLHQTLNHNCQQSTNECIFISIYFNQLFLIGKFSHYFFIGKSNHKVLIRSTSHIYIHTSFDARILHVNIISCSAIFFK